MRLVFRIDILRPVAVRRVASLVVVWVVLICFVFSAADWFRCVFVRPEDADCPCRVCLYLAVVHSCRALCEASALLDL